MRKISLYFGVCLVIVSIGGFLVFPRGRLKNEMILKSAQHSLMNLPLHFEENIGQFDLDVQFTSNAQMGRYFFTPQKVVLQRDGLASLSLQFVGANPHPEIVGESPLESKSHYFRGNDPTKWQTNVANYQRIRYADVYPGIDLLFYGNASHLEYDICLSPQTPWQDIRLRVEGADHFELTPEGNLYVYCAKEHALVMQKPYVYQEIDGQICEVEGAYSLLAANEVGFSIGKYDPSQQLIIDPVVSYSTYVGGSGDEFAFTSKMITVDMSGNAYFTGYSSSTNYPTTPGAYQTSKNGINDIVVTKLNSSGSALVYSTYIGGTGGDNQGYSIAIDPSGNAYIAGSTTATTFPTTTGAFETTAIAGTKAVFVKLNSTGSGLLYSTYLRDTASGAAARLIVVDSVGNAIISGTVSSTGFPITLNAYNGTFPGGASIFVSKINPAGGGSSDLLYSSYLGGTFTDTPEGLALGSNDNIIYLAGSTNSGDFPTTIGAVQTIKSTGFDMFISRLDLSAGTSGLLYSTFLGGTGTDSALSLALGPTGHILVSGRSNSTDFPTTLGAYQTTIAGLNDVVIAKINPGTDGMSDLLYSSYIGEVDTDFGNSLVTDSEGNFYVTGYTNSPNFPITADAFQSSAPGTLNAFFLKLAPNGDGVNDLIYSTFLGGSSSNQGYSIAKDTLNGFYVFGITNSNNFPTTTNAFQKTRGGGFDFFVTKFQFPLPPPTLSPPTGLTGHQIKNIDAFSVEYVNVLAWSPPLSGNSPASYRIYRDAALSDFIGSVSSFEKLKFFDRHRKRKRTYSYYIVSVDSDGAVSNSSSMITIP